MVVASSSAIWSLVCISFFFFNDTATTEIYTLSLHDALPIYTEPVLTVPVYAVGEDEKGNYVFALKGTDDPEVFLATKQTIEVGELTTNGFKIVNGLTQGEKIAAAGLHILLDGQKVKLLN